jgi:ferric-dicitrate binding protein FerR (iron transport regulator)
MINEKDIPDDIKLLISSSLGRNIDKSESKRLQQWLDEDEWNKEIYNDLRTSWVLAGRSSYGKKEFSGLTWEKVESRIHDKNKGSSELLLVKTPFIHFLRTAATWILLFLSGGVVSWWLMSKSRNGELATTEIVAPLGAKSMVKMPDGTMVWLNAGSKLSYKNDFNQSDRQVTLTGEAFFSVTTNKEKPFVVHASDVMVRAFGTKFNVKAYPDEETVTATLQEGKIDVQFTGKLTDHKNVILLPNQKVVLQRAGTLGPNKKIQKRQPSEKIEAISPRIALEKDVDIDLYTSWKSDRWTIQGVPLETLAPMLERRFNKKLYFRDRELKDYKFTGTIANETVEQILNALQMTAPLDFKIGRDSIILSLNPRAIDHFQHIITPKR